ncbi:MAG: helix-turn-helix domain-containing protein [Hyphomicrobiaceae bacterium]
MHRQTWSALELRTLLEATVASGFDIDEERLRQPTRGEARIALARQVAMYLAHIGCGLSKAGVGRLFERDRTTVHHACLVIEQRRDDAQFDLALDHMERVVRIVVGPLEASWAA